MNRHPILYAFLLIGLIAASIVAIERGSIERSRRCVAMVVDYDEVASCAAGSGTTVTQALAEFKAAGITGVSAPERSFGELVNRGEVHVTRDASWAPNGIGPTRIGADTWTLYFSRPQTAQIARESLIAKFPGQLKGADGEWLRHDVNEVMGSTTIRDYPALTGVGAAIDQDAVRAAKDAGLAVTVRLVNYPGIEQSGIDFMVKEASLAGADAVIASEKEVVGFPGSLKATAAALTQYGISYGSVEFASQLGDQTLSTMLDGQVLRVHSIEAKEMPQYTPTKAVERYVRAVRERNVRMLYVRLFPQGDPNPLAQNNEYCRALRSALVKAGYNPGAPSEIAAPGLSAIRLLELACGVAAGFVLLLTAFWSLRSRSQVILLIVVTIIGGLAAIALPSMGAKLLALAAALIFPCLGVIDAHRVLDKQEWGGFWARSARAAMWVLVISMTSVIGGLLIAAILSRVPYMTQTDQFRGVKLTLTMPLFVIGAAYVTKAFARDETLSAWWARVRYEASVFFRSPVLLWHGVIVAVALGALALMVTRSGNAPPVGVSGMEMKLRAFFDTVFAVRPRTKEFAFGHPLLFLAIALARDGRKRYVPALLVLGVIGQASLVNTFCHLHTPIIYTLMRTANGLICGLILGIILYAVVRLLTRRSP